MAYKYVTENNLYDKQTYMYSQYNGIQFLKEYLGVRQEYLKKNASLGKCAAEKTEGQANAASVMCDLLHIKKILKSDKQNKETIDLMNAYTKSFEVRKRIYQEYDSDWKPTGSMNFEDYEIYLTFAECLVLSYRHTQCLKYFSCLLKVDDTLLSVSGQMDLVLKGELYQIIKKELAIFYEIAEKNGISLEE